MYFIGIVLGAMALWLLHTFSELRALPKRVEAIEGWWLRPPHCADCGEAIKSDDVPTKLYCGCSTVRRGEAMGDLPEGWDVPRVAIHAAFKRDQ